MDEDKIDVPLDVHEESKNNSLHHRNIQLPASGESAGDLPSDAQQHDGKNDETVRQIPKPFQIRLESYVPEINRKNKGVDRI